MLRFRLFGLPFLAVLTLALSGMSGAQASRWGKDYFPNAAVITQDGKTLKFYDDLIKDKIFVISFLFTSCKDICPLATARLAELQEMLGDSMGRDIFFYSISIDPETDTPERLKQYADTFRAGPGWLFLTGRPEDIHTIRHKLGERSQVLSEHRNEVLLGNGATGEWARNNVLGDLNSLAITVRGMDPKWRPTSRQARADPKALKVDFTARPGQALFKRLCAGCHTVGSGDRVGPDLAGVAARRDRAWLASYISNPEKMRMQNDPIALALAAKFQGVRMPALGVGEVDAADLLSYIAHLETQYATRLRPLEPLFALTTHRGLRLAPELVNDQPLAVVFGFTRCPERLPDHAARLVQRARQSRARWRPAQGTVRLGRQRAGHARGAQGVHGVIRSAHHCPHGECGRDRRRSAGLRRLLREGCGERRWVNVRPHHQDLFRRP